MFNNIEAVFIDLDKTLTTRKKKFIVSLDNKLALKDLQKRNKWVVISTGRTKENIVRIWNQIHINNYSDYVLYSNGAIIENFTTGEILYSKLLSNKSILDFLNYIKKNGKNWLFRFANSDLFYTFGEVNYKFKFLTLVSDEFKIKKFSLTEFTKENKDYETAKIGLVASISLKKTSEIIEDIKKHFPDFKIVTSGVKFYIEINAKDVSKGTAAKILAEKLKINLKNAIAIGDSLNDYDILKSVGHPVIMGDSDKRLEEIAEFKTKKASKDGVAKVIDNINS